MELSKIYLSEDWYKYLVEDCRNAFGQRLKNSREELILGYAEVGERIFNDPNYHKFSRENTKFLDRLSEDIGIGKRNMYYAVEFYNKFLKGKEVLHGVQSLPFEEGENISWNKIKDKYLTSRKDIPEEHLTTCPNCGFKFK